MAAPVKSSPRDAQVMAAILKDMGVLEYEPRLINQMLEFTYRYITDILDDAKVYSTHANKKGLDTDDIKLAIQTKMDHSFTSPPPRDLLMEIARHKNNQQLPLIKPYSLPRLPPDRYCLSAANYKLKTRKKPKIIGLPQFSSGQQRFTITPMQAKSSTLSGTTLTVVTKPQPTVTIISKPTVTAVPKPTIRVNTGPTVISKVTRPIPTATTIHTTHLQTPQTQFSGQPIMSALNPLALNPLALNPLALNPLKRKLEDDDYDRS